MWLNKITPNNNKTSFLITTCYRQNNMNTVATKKQFSIIRKCNHINNNPSFFRRLLNSHTHHHTTISTNHKTSKNAIMEIKSNDKNNHSNNNSSFNGKYQRTFLKGLLLVVIGTTIIRINPRALPAAATGVGILAIIQGVSPIKVFVVSSVIIIAVPASMIWVDGERAKISNVLNEAENILSKQNPHVRVDLQVGFEHVTPHKIDMDTQEIISKVKLYDRENLYKLPEERIVRLIIKRESRIIPYLDDQLVLVSVKLLHTD
jgi:hypothetical protein